MRDCLCCCGANGIIILDECVPPSNCAIIESRQWRFAAHGFNAINTQIASSHHIERGK